MRQIAFPSLAPASPHPTGRRRARLAATSVLGVGAVLACVSLSTPARAAAFYIQEQSTRGAGRAYSGEAADTGPESLWWNPAAIASSPAEAFGSISGLFPSTDINDRGSTLSLPIPPSGLTVPVGGLSHAGNPILDGMVAAAGYARPIGDRFAVGLSMTAPFDEVTKYPSNSFARYEALKSRLDTADLQLTGALKAAPWLDLGVGVDAVYTSARLSEAAPNLAPGAPDGFSGVHGDGWNWGWNIGAQLHPMGDKWNLGLSYRSAVGRSLSGEVDVSGLGGPLAAANVNARGSAKFTTPWVATIAARVRVTPQLTLDAQVQRVGWSQFRNIQIAYPGVSEIVPENYHDTTTAAVGVDYALNPRLTLRTGVQWDPTPTPKIGRTLRIPDGTRWLFSAGGELKVSDRLTVEGAVEYATVQSSRIDSQAVFYQGTPAEVVANYSASSTASAVVVSGGVRWRF